MYALKVAGYLSALLPAQLFHRIPYPTFDFSGQTVIVTGANSGLGLDAARHIARLGAAKVILAVRTVSKGEAAAKDIASSTGVSEKEVLEVWQLDMSSSESVKAFAKRAAALPRLDAVLLNAGVQTTEYRTAQGNEETLAVNVINTLLLAVLLLPTLRDSAQKQKSRGRLALVGSDLNYIAIPSELVTDGSIIDKLNDKKQANMLGRYMLSKLLVLYTVREISRRSPLSPTSNVIVNVLSPGYCASNLRRDDTNAFVKVGTAVVDSVVQRTQEVGSRMLVHGVAPKLPAEAHGKFLWNHEIAADGWNTTSAQGKQLAPKWNKELFQKLEELAPGSTACLNA